MSFVAREPKNKNGLWKFAVDAHAQFTHSVVDRSINVLLWTGCLVAKAIECTRRFTDRHVIRFFPIATEKN